MTQTILIYGLHDPRDGALRYVGKTRHSLSVRLAQHMTPKELSLKHRRAIWLRCLKAQGLKPEARVIELATADTWEARERHWIAFHRAQGANLVNGTDGGEGGATSKGKPCSEARREAIARALKGHKVSEHTREKLRAARTGVPSVNKITLDDALLTDLYVKRGKTSKQVGLLLGISDRPVLRRLRELGLIRTWPEARRLAVTVHNCANRKLDAEDVRVIRKLLSRRVGVEEIANRYGVSRVTIRNIERGITWTWLN